MEMANERLLNHRHDYHRLLGRRSGPRLVADRGRQMIESIGYGMMAVGAVGACWGVARLIDPTCYDKPKPTNTDTLFRGAKQCHNCLHHSISPEHPLLACGQRGVKVEPHHFCDEWA